MIVDEIRKELFDLRDEAYAAFQLKLIPTAEPDSFIGVRTPALRTYAKAVAKRSDVDTFLSDLPHKYFDENQLHAFVLSEMKDFDKCVQHVEAFLPYVDNWATCDQMSPKVFKKYKEQLLPRIRSWIASSETYMIRFGIGMLMAHFLDDDFDPAYPEMVANVQSEEYYVNMMVAWYFATALAKQYNAIVPYIEEQRLPAWTHNKTIQKAVESYRITPEQKTYLKTFKVRKEK